MNKEESFLSRWARRKGQQEPHARDSEVVLETTDTADATKATKATKATELDDEQLIASDSTMLMPPDEETRQAWIEELEKIDISALNYSDDFKIFMQGWVPQALRQRALRKLWTTDPVLACLDGLNDYEEDFTDAATVVKNLRSSWQPAAGWIKPPDEDGVDELDVGVVEESEGQQMMEAAENLPNQPKKTVNKTDVKVVLESDETLCDGAEQGNTT